MGAWGKGSFDNDSALDWMGELVEGDDLALVMETLALRGDATQGADVLAAAEVVAALNGRPLDRLPEELGEWLVDKAALGRAVTRKAIEAVEWVWGFSELRELWEDAGKLDAWGAELAKLRHRLSKRAKRRKLRPRDMAKVAAREAELKKIHEEMFPVKATARPGDLIGIPLSDGRMGLALVITYDKPSDDDGLAGGVGLVLRNTLLPGDAPPDEEVVEDDVIACLSMGWWDLGKGTWKVLRSGLPTAIAAGPQRRALELDLEFANPNGGQVGCVVVQELLEAYHGLRPRSHYAGGPDAYAAMLLPPPEAGGDET